MRVRPAPGSVPFSITKPPVRHNGHYASMKDIDRDSLVEDALRHTNARFEAAIAAADVSISNQDRELRYTWIHNPALIRAPRDVIGKRDGDLLERAADAARLDAIKRAVLETGTDIRQEVAVMHGGVEHYFDLLVRPQRDAAGAIVGVTNAAIEITGRKRVEANLSFLSTLAAALTPLTSAAEVADVVTSSVAKYLGLSRCLLVAIDPTGSTATVFHEHSQGGSSLLGPYAMLQFHTEDERRQLAMGHAIVISDVRAAPRPAAAGAQFEQLGIRAMLNVPYLSDGQLRFVLSAMCEQPHTWQPGDTELLQGIASRAYLRLERARGEEQLRAAHDTFRHLVDRSPFGIYVVDADFRLVQVSTGAQKVFEQVRPLLGRDFADVLRLLWPEPFAGEAIAIFRHTLDTGEPYHAPSTVEKRQDIGVVESYDWKTERLMLPDGRWGVVCHFYDLSERQRFEAELRDADRQKDLFLAMLAHELRNPLAPIRTAAAVLQTAAAKEIVTACAETIERQSAQMARLLDDLLDVSRLSRGRLSLQRAPIALADVLAVAVETSQPSIDAHQQQLSVDAGDESLVVDGDSVRLAQVFANLLHNASKFGTPGGRIAIQARREDDDVVVRVTDSGIGIPAELLPRLFGLFVQGAAERGGLGIGLSLAQRLIDMHGGTIAAHSDGPGKGSEFTVRLPLTSAPITRHHDSADHALSPVARKALIVDDNADVAEITALLLKSAGCDVRIAYDGATALDAAQAFQPEVVFMDLGMPGLDGYETCRRIRASSSGQSVQMIAVSGWARPEDKQRSAAAGFDLHLVKPVDPRTLIKIVGA